MKSAEVSYESSKPVRQRGWKSSLLWGLVALNALLVALVVNRFIPAQTANAQAARPSDYLMVPGQLNGVVNGVVFIIDTSKGELSAMSYDDTTNVLSPMPKLDLAQVFKAGQGVGTGVKPVKPR